MDVKFAGSPNLRLPNDELSRIGGFAPEDLHNSFFLCSVRRKLQLL